MKECREAAIDAGRERDLNSEGDRLGMYGRGGKERLEGRVWSGVVEPDDDPRTSWRAAKVSWSNLFGVSMGCSWPLRTGS